VRRLLIYVVHSGNYDGVEWGVVEVIKWEKHQAWGCRASYANPSPCSHGPLSNQATANPRTRLRRTSAQKRDLMAIWRRFWLPFTANQDELESLIGSLEVRNPIADLLCSK